MTIDILLSPTSVGQELRRRWADIDQAAKAPHRVVATMLTVKEALASNQWRPHVLEMLVAASGGVVGKGPQLECMACSRPWTMSRKPQAILMIELLSPIERGLVAGICPGCAGRQDLWNRVASGLERDLGIEAATCRPVALSGGA